MNEPFPATGYVKRKLYTGNQSVQFDEEREVEKSLFYSTICVHLRLIFVSLWCLIILKDKPQMNADERRFVIWGSVYINSFLILFNKNSGDTYS